MKTFLNLVALVACMLALAALPCRAGYVYWETFNYYSNGYGVVNQSDGKWMPWKGSATSDDALISNNPPNFASHLRLSQAEAIGNAGFQEVVSFFPDALGAAPRARLRMSINYQGGAKNSDFYLWMCSGDAAALDTAYAESGPGGLIVNWAGLGSGNTVPLHIWNTFGIWKIADITSGQWHEIQYDIVKNQVGITGGLVGFTIDGTYFGAVPFPLRLQDSVTSNVINAFDFYAMDNDVLLVDNIVIEDIPVDIIATNFYVSVTGNDANDGTTPANAWATLGHALTMLEGIGIQLNPSAFVTATEAQPLPTQQWAVINVSTGMFVGEKNIAADTLDIYRLGYSNLPTFVRNEQLHNFLIVKGAGIGKTIFVDQLCSNDAKFKIYSRWVRLEDFTLWGQGLGGGETFFLDPIHFRPVDGLAMDFRVERVQVCPAPGAPPELLGNRAGVSFLANWRDCRNKVVRGCLFNAVGIGVKNYNNVAKFPVLVENCTFADLGGAPFSYRGIGVLCEGAGGWVKNCLFANITTNALDLTRGIGVHTWPILAANRKTAFSQVYLVDNNMFNIGQNGINFTKMDDGASYIAGADMICNGPVVFQTLDDMPYRAGLGNIGYKAARGGTYYVDRNSPIVRNSGAMGTSWSSAFRSPGYAVDLLGQSPPLSDATYPVTYYLRGKFTNEFTASNSNPKVGRGIQLPGTSDYVTFIGEGPDKTLIYKNSDFRNETGADGRNLTIYPTSKQSCTIRNMALVAESWFPPGANAYSYGAFRNWNSRSFLSNVYVSVLYRDTNTMQLVGLDTRQTAAISVNGTPLLEAIDCCFEGGYNGFRANDGPLTQKFTSCTFKGVYSPDGDSLGGYGVLLVGGNRNVELNKCIIGDSTRGAVYLGNNSTIFGDDNIIYGNGTTGVVNEGTGTDALTNNKTFDPLLATYNSHPLASPYRASGYGWYYRPLDLINSSWPMAGRNKQRQGWYTNGAPLTVAAVLWTNASAYASVDMWGAGTKLGSAATDGQRVFVQVNAVPANNYATLLALDAATGSNLWAATLGSAGKNAHGTPAVGETMVYYGEVMGDNNPQWVAAVDRLTGQIVWSNTVDTMNASAFMLHDGKVYFDTDWLVGGTWCLDALTGAMIWTNRFSAGDWGSSGMPLSPDGTVIYNHGDDGYLHAMDTSTGAHLWKFGPFEDGQGNFEPVVDNAGNIYCYFPGLTNDQPLVIFKVAPGGTPLWTNIFTIDSADGGMALSPDGSTLYVSLSSTSTDFGLFALDTASGALKWSANVGKGGGSPVVGAGNIIVSTFASTGQLYARGIQDNGMTYTVLWSVPLGPVHGGWSNNKSAFVRPCILPNGDVIVQNPAGLIACISIPEPALGALAALALLLVRRRR